MEILPDKEYLLKFADAKMPFGKYAGWLLLDLPEPYVVWFRQKRFPKGKLGEMFNLLYEIKVNGLEYLFDQMRKQGQTKQSKDYASSDQIDEMNASQITTSWESIGLPNVSDS